MDCPRIGGIKLSKELSQINIVGSPECQNLQSRISQLLAFERLNMHLLAQAGSGRRPKLSFCVSAKDVAAVRRVLNANDFLDAEIEVVHGLGSVSLFPYQCSLNILGLSLVAFGEASIPIYGLASSLSSLTFVTDYSRLNAAVESLKHYFRLPSNHAPM
jgi:aspartokinase